MGDIRDYFRLAGRGLEYRPVGLVYLVLGMQRGLLAECGCGQRQNEHKTRRLESRRGRLEACSTVITATV